MLHLSVPMLDLHLRKFIVDWCIIMHINNIVIYYSGLNACEYNACDNGTLAQGWGSGSAEFPYLIDVSCD
jgi:hypothetical protein